MSWVSARDAGDVASLVDTPTSLVHRSWVAYSQQYVLFRTPCALLACLPVLPNQVPHVLSAASRSLAVSVLPNRRLSPFPNDVRSRCSALVSQIIPSRVTVYTQSEPVRCASAFRNAAFVLNRARSCLFIAFLDDLGLFYVLRRAKIRVNPSVHGVCSCCGFACQ